MQRQASRTKDGIERLSALRTRAADAQNRLDRLYAAIESGVADPSEPTLKDRVAAVKSERDRARSLLDRTAATETNAGARITDEKIAAFTDLMRSRILEGDNPFRRTYIRLGHRRGRGGQFGNQDQGPPPTLERLVRERSRCG